MDCLYRCLHYVMQSYILSHSSVLPLMLTVPVFITGNVSHCYVNFTQPYRYVYSQLLYSSGKPQQSLYFPLILYLAYNIKPEGTDLRLASGSVYEKKILHSQALNLKHTSLISFVWLH